jgi:ORF6N domain
VRCQRVLLDADLARFYGDTTKRLNQQGRRNRERFLEDFMFELAAEEFQAVRSQFATSNDRAPSCGGRRYAPRVFTEHGALMAATILSSPRAIEVSAYVVRAFVRMRELATTHGDLAKRLAELEDKTEALAMNHDTFSGNTRNQLREVFDALRELMAPPDPHKRPIGFVTPEDTGSKKASAKNKG